MTSTSTVDEMIVHLFGERCLQAFDQIDIAVTSSKEDSILTIDELTNSYLGKEVNSAFPNIDLKEERVGIEVTLDHIHVRVGMQGLSLLFVIVVIAALLLGSGVVLTMLQTVFRT